MMKASALTHRYIARLEFEAVTPLFIGAGKSGALVDALIRTDWNGLPMIPGTSLTGVLRHDLEPGNDAAYWKDLFGHQDGNKGVGSRLRLSDALLIVDDDKVYEEANTQIPTQLLTILSNLPVRKHVRISKKGAAETNGLFDNQVLPKGARFRCEIMLMGNADDQLHWEALLQTFSSPMFRIGQGTRNGYGKLKVHRMGSSVLDISGDKSAFNEFLNWDPSLNNGKPELKAPATLQHHVGEGIRSYQLALKPDDFFIFGSGRGDEHADQKPVTEWEFVYDQSKKLSRSKPLTLIPATSIKGALAHRVCYHHNRLNEWFVDDPKGCKAYTAEKCPAVQWLFGSASNENNDPGKGHVGRVIIDDVLKAGVKDDSIFFHVTIDRFTGGALPGFLFSERVNNLPTTKDEDAIMLSVHVDMRDKAGYEDTFTQALELALGDIWNGRLPLGGMTTKGHGVFRGKMSLIQKS